jgi:Family of unknown function (DUF6220)
MARRIAGLIHLIAAWLLVVGLLVQVFLAGMGIFDDPSAFATHATFGHLLEFLPVLVLVAAIVAGYGRWRALAGLGLLVLLFLQTILVLQDESAPVVAALHPVNAFLLLLAASLVAWDSTRLWRSRRGAPEAMTEPEAAAG